MSDALKQLADAQLAAWQAFRAALEPVPPPPPPPDPPPDPGQAPVLRAYQFTPANGRVMAGQPIRCSYQIDGAAKAWALLPVTLEQVELSLPAGTVDLLPSATGNVWATGWLYIRAENAAGKQATWQLLNVTALDAPDPNPGPGLLPPSPGPQMLASAKAAIARFSQAPSAVAVASGSFFEADNWRAQSGEAGVHSIGGGIAMEVDGIGGELPEDDGA